MMIASWVPMFLIVVVLLTTDTLGISFLFVPLACIAVMVMTMRT